MHPIYWNKACKSLAKSDPVMAELIKRHKTKKMRRRSTSFSVLARAMVGQQISTKAAQSIWNRLRELTGKVTPDSIIAAKPSALRQCGLSEMKVSFLKDLASHFDEGRISPYRFRFMED